MAELTTQHDALLDELLKDGQGPEDMLGQHGLLKPLTKRLVERALEAELTAPLGYERQAKAQTDRENPRHGRGSKTLQTETGPLEIPVPRDRAGRFEPPRVPKRQRRLAGVDEGVLSRSARGLSTREIQAPLEELYGTEVSAALSSQVTAAVLEEVKAWQGRPLEPRSPILYLDALVAKSREDGVVRNQAVYRALGVTLSGQTELLGLWIAQTEGAKCWLQVLTELKHRGMQDCLIAWVAGRTGFPEALEAVFPKPPVQLGLVHQVRTSLASVSYQERRAVARDLKAIYTAPTLEQAEQALDQLAATWDQRYPAMSPAWIVDWDRLPPCLAYPPEIRNVIYTTHAIESRNRSLRRVLKTRGALPTDEAIRQVLDLALRQAAKKWTLPVANWPAALNHFVILFGDRMPQGERTQLHR